MDGKVLLTHPSRSGKQWNQHRLSGSKPVSNLTVAENIFIGREPMKMGRIDWKTMNTQAQKILDNLELEIDATQELENYSVAIQQMVRSQEQLTFSQKY